MPLPHCASHEKASMATNQKAWCWPTGLVVLALVLALVRLLGLVLSPGRAGPAQRAASKAEAVILQTKIPSSLCALASRSALCIVFWFQPHRDLVRQYHAPVL